MCSIHFSIRHALCIEQIAIQRKKEKEVRKRGGHSRLRKKKIFNLCHKDMDGSAPISRLKGPVVCTNGKRKKCGESEEKTASAVQP